VSEKTGALIANWLRRLLQHGGDVFLEGQVVGYIKISVLGGRWSCLSRVGESDWGDDGISVASPMLLFQTRKLRWQGGFDRGLEVSVMSSWLML